MVDITAKIIWYRLGEAYENAIEASHEFSEWYEQFSWRKVDILDMLFLGWLLVAFIVVGIINLYLRFFGLPRSKQSLGTSSSSSSPGSLKGRDVGEGESVDWINAALSWFFLHYNHTPEFVDSWMRALNEQARKHATDYQIRFERVQAGSLPPTFHDVTAQVAEKQYLSLKSRVEAKDMTLLVAVIQQSATNIKMSNYDVTVTNLKGRVKIHSTYANNELQANVSFDQSPELQLKITPRDYQSKVDTEMLDRVVRQSLAGAVTVVSLPTQGGYPSFYLPTDNIQAGGGISTITKDKKLLVKVIKANGLGDKDFGCCDPYCIITTDIPDQTNTTSVVKNTINPFWDEHFIFDVEDNTKQLKFEVYNQEKRDALLGKADIHVSELRRMPSSRQIIPLTGRPGSATTTSGSITVEFLFMDAVESQNLIANHDAVSPRRQVETNRKLTPGGTLVTTTTTTTQKPKDHRMDATGYNETPSMIEKMESDLNQEYPGYSPTTPTAHLGAHEAGLNASQEAIALNGTENVAQTAIRDLESSKNRGSNPGTPAQRTLIITGIQRDPAVPVIKMTESSPAEQDVTSHSSSMDAHVGTPDKKKVKKSKSFASTLKRKFQRNPKKNRSQSADRATMRDSSLLRPPDNREHRASEDGDPTDVPTGGTLRKSRSHSFSSSLKRLFRKKKKDGDISRDNSMSRGSTRSHQEAGSHSPQLSSYSRNSSLRQPSPDVAARDFSYSSSVPAAPSPLYDQYKVQ